jgi:hypothetical protein
VAVIGQNEVQREVQHEVQREVKHKMQHEFPIPSWRSSNTEHGKAKEMKSFLQNALNDDSMFEHRMTILLAATKLQHLYWHLLLCSTDEWSGRRRNSVAGEINLNKTHLNLGLNPAPEALWPRIQVNRCALGSTYISLLKIHDCWS